MTLLESSFRSFDGIDFKYHKWMIEEPIGTVIIFHGMAEHSERYGEFAEFLNNNGYDVYAMDFRGHGKNTGTQPGYFADKNGWQTVLSDMKLFVDHIFEKATTKNIVLMGHSMGSLLLRSYLIKFYDQRIEKVVLSGTPAAPSVTLLKCAQLISETNVILGGRKKPSALLDRLVFGKYSTFIMSPVTPFDWLSHDKNAVQKYIDDPYCGYICTGSFFRDLFKGMTYCNEPLNVGKIDPAKKVLIISGDEDPAGDYGKAPMLLQEKLRIILKKDNVVLKIYKGYRHEIINEIGKNQVYEDIMEFIHNK